MCFYATFSLKHFQVEPTCLDSGSILLYFTSELIARKIIQRSATITPIIATQAIIPRIELGPRIFFDPAHEAASILFWCPQQDSNLHTSYLTGTRFSVLLVYQFQHKVKISTGNLISLIICRST